MQVKILLRVRVMFNPTRITPLLTILMKKPLKDMIIPAQNCQSINLFAYSHLTRDVHSSRCRQEARYVLELHAILLVHKSKILQAAERISGALHTVLVG